MDLFDAIEHRRSVRQFQTEKMLDDDMLQKILHAAVMAPSSGNTQCWRFIVVRDQNTKQRLAVEAGHQNFISQAPVAIVVCADLERAANTYGERGFGTYALQDTAAATENMLLAIHAMGLGACWVGAFDEKMASNILKLPKTIRPMAIIPIGFSAEPTKRVPPRRNLDEVVDFR